MTTAVTHEAPYMAAAIIRFECEPGGCHHPSLPHISDVTANGTFCAAGDVDGNMSCTMPAGHTGVHVAGNGDYLVGLWDPHPGQWRLWTPTGDRGTQTVWAVVSITGDETNASTGCVFWEPDETAARALYAREAGDHLPGEHQRVRLLRLPVPVHDGTDQGREWITDYLTDLDLDWTLPCVEEMIHVPEGDPEPTVDVLVEPAVWDARDNLLYTGERAELRLNRALRTARLDDVARLDDDADFRDEFIIAAGAVEKGPFTVTVSTTYRDPETGEADTDEGAGPWLAWARRHASMFRDD